MKKIFKENRLVIIIGLVLILALGIIISYTYSFFQVQESNSTVIAGEAESMNMSLEVKKVSSGSGKLIPQMGEYILSAVQGRNGSCVDDNNNTVCQVYRITLQNKGSSTIMVNGTVELDNKDNPNLKWTTISGFTEGEKPTSAGVSRTADNTILTTNEEYTANQTKQYYIVVWINETGLSQTDTGIFNGVVNFRNTDGSVEVNAPEVVDGLVPVIHNGETWVTADETNTNNSWYNYNEKRWANAVLVTDTKRASLTTNADGTYTAGQTIGDTEAEGVLAFYVWIPRYKYKVWNINKVADQSVYTYDAYTNGIDIQFERETETTGGITCNYDFTVTDGSLSETCSDSGTEGYYTHPAFTFGEDEITGFWMGKFELSSNDQNYENSAGGTSITLSTRVLPNVIAWTNNNASNYYTVIKNMQASENEYGLLSDQTNTDSHMLTDMEWGAVAYLTHSEYGRCTDDICTEVAINDSGAFVGTMMEYYIGYTGRSSAVGGSSDSSEQGTYTYDETNGQLASTTGNIYGVYDMSGGLHELLMGNVSLTPGIYEYNPNYAGSNYTYEGFEKYITTYAYGTTDIDQTAYNRARLGDATSEVLLTPGYDGGWYGDYARFPYSEMAWVLRGSAFNGANGAGVFSFSNELGSEGFVTTSRAALVGF